MPTPSFNFPEPIRTGAVPPASRPAPAPNRTRPADREPAAPAADRVEISPEAQALRSLTARLQSIPENRPDLVEQVRAQVADIAHGAAQNARLAERLLTEN